MTLHHCIHNNDCNNEEHPSYCFRGLTGNQHHGYPCSLYTAKEQQTLASNNVYCDPDIEDNVCLLNGWAINNNGSFRNAGPVANNIGYAYYELRPGERNHVQGHETEVDVLDTDEVSRRKYCNMFSYNQTINNCRLKDIDISQSIDRNACTGCDEEIHIFNKLCNDTDEHRNLLVDEFTDMDATNNGDLFRQRLIDINNVCNTSTPQDPNCNLITFSEAVDNCDGMNVDLTQEVNPNSCDGCTELHTFNANCMNTDEERLALLDMWAGANANDPANFYQRVENIHNYCVPSLPHSGH